MIKCGILTFHNAGNFGASLQAYALWEKLEELGCDCRVIDYTSPYHAPKPDASVYDKVFFRCLTHGMIRTAYRYSKRQRELQKSLRTRMRASDDFAKEYSMTPKVGNADEINALGLDMIVCGSDQIWCRMQGRYDPIFFADDLNGYRISYAASGYAPDGGKSDKEFRKLLGGYNLVSVRETSLCAVLDEIGIECTAVCDPVFLAGRETLDKVSRSISLDDEYVFVYNLGRSPDVSRAGEIISERCGVKILYCDGIGAYADFDGRKVGLASPCEFIDAVKRAKCIVTNSFHGTALSLLYHVPVVPVLFKNKSRVADMMQTFRLSNRIITKPDDAKAIPLNGTDYAAVDGIINGLRDKSCDYLRCAIKAAQRSKE